MVSIRSYWAPDEEGNCVVPEEAHCPSQAGACSSRLGSSSPHGFTMRYALVVLGIALLVGCAHVSPPPPAAPDSARPTGDPRASRILGVEPSFLEIEASDSIPRGLSLLDRIRERADADDPWVLYLRARLLLRLTIVARFERDHGAASDANSEERTEAWTAEGTRAVERALSIQDEESEFHRVRGEIYSMRIRSFAAGLRFGSTVTSSLARAHALDAQNPHVHIALGKRYLFAPRMLGRDDDAARRFLEHARDLAPELADAWFYLGSYHEQRAERSEAIRCLDRCLELQPNRAMAAALRRLVVGSSPDP